MGREDGASPRDVAPLRDAGVHDQLTPQEQEYQEGALIKLNKSAQKLAGLSATRSFNTPEEAAQFIDALVALNDEVWREMPVLGQKGTLWTREFEGVLRKAYEVIPQTIKKRFPMTKNW